uniref:HAUS augmin-like complex subunit 5 n=1 Tax=Leptobrachium leishanense TaxID=445787 RepID=A0A8C5QNG4_9ANUR
MDRRSLAQEVRRWALEEMGLAPQKAPSEELLQRLFIGQCSDIWKYVVHHVFSQGYQQLKQSETQKSVEEEQSRRRKQLCRQILDLRSELQHLQEQIHCSEQEITRCSLSSERSQDFCHRALLLQAFKKKRDEECDALTARYAPIKQRISHLQALSRSSQRPVVYGISDVSAAPIPYPDALELMAVQEMCKDRYDFLRSIYDKALNAPVLANSSLEEHTQTHKQWMSDVQKFWSMLPPNIVIAAVKHAAMETSDDARKLQTLHTVTSCVEPLSIRPFSPSQSDDDSDEEPEGDILARSHRGRLVSILHGRPGKIPTFQRLLQEGWEDSVKVTTGLHLIQHRVEQLSEQLATVIQETQKKLSDEGDVAALTRAAFDTELRAVLLRGYRDGLLLECRVLQDSVNARKQEARLLQEKKQDVEEHKHLLSKKRHQFHILLQEAQKAEDRLRNLHNELKVFVHGRLQPLPQQLLRESERLQDAVQKEIKHFSAIFLPSLQKVSVQGGGQVPVHELSINRLSSVQNPHYSNYRVLYSSLQIPFYKSPECLLNVLADLRKDMFFMHTQLAFRWRAMQNLQNLSDGQHDPDTEALLTMLAEHYAKQMNYLIPKLQYLVQQCDKRMEYAKTVQAVMTDWWEQPAQQCLPGEQRGGLTLQQWRDRWTVAATSLQRVSGGRN